MFTLVNVLLRLPDPVVVLAAGSGRLLHNPAGALASDFVMRYLSTPARLSDTPRTPGTVVRMPALDTLRVDGQARAVVAVSCPDGSLCFIFTPAGQSDDASPDTAGAHAGLKSSDSLGSNVMQRLTLEEIKYLGEIFSSHFGPLH